MSNFLPIEVSEWYDTELDCNIVKGVMTRDFGPWLKGTTPVLTFDFINGTISEYNDDGGLVNCESMRLEIV